VVAKLTTENFVWFWFKICWKWVQGSLSFKSPKEEDQTHTSQMTWLEGWYFKHWTVAGSCLQCCMCTTNHKRTTTKFQCIKCKVDLCLCLCFRIYYTETHFWIMSSLHHRKETIARNKSTVHFLITPCFISVIYNFFLEKIIFTSKK